MNLLILGASGGVGRHLQHLAAEAGHRVTALVRPTTPFSPHPALRVIPGQVTAPEDLARALEGQEAVLSCLGIQRVNPANPWSPLACAPDFCSSSAAALVQAMKGAGVPRVVAVSAAGVGDSAASLNAIMRFFLASSKVGIAYADLERMEAVYAASGLDWCCPRPTRLTDGPPAPARETAAFGTFDAISRASVAAWMLAAATGPAFASRTPQITG